MVELPRRSSPSNGAEENFDPVLMEQIGLLIGIASAAMPKVGPGISPSDSA